MRVRRGLGVVVALIVAIALSTVSPAVASTKKTPNLGPQLLTISQMPAGWSVEHYCAQHVVRVCAGQ